MLRVCTWSKSLIRSCRMFCIFTTEISHRFSTCNTYSIKTIKQFRPQIQTTQALGRRRRSLTCSITSKISGCPLHTLLDFTAWKAISIYCRTFRRQGNGSKPDYKPVVAWEFRMYTNVKSSYFNLH
ncbi:hypothetical protein KC19_6G106600 [Ceratodon purpureus]|uniref:Uncharacterized protein n=1 Tax=Ceratodon purpureus TaxID=3225 RepID=A0A8T0HDR3_CERPU|nr:hypothetical protein KC19_6G106600 [Ceratodon purpureus]